MRGPRGRALTVPELRSSLGAAAARIRATLGSLERLNLVERVAGSRAGLDGGRLLALLSTGLTDQVMARQLGIGHRTFQRRPRDLMKRLGATTRFQLGLRAAGQGWVVAGGGRSDEGAGGRN